MRFALVVFAGRSLPSSSPVHLLHHYTIQPWLRERGQTSPFGILQWLLLVFCGEIKRDPSVEVVMRGVTGGQGEEEEAEEKEVGRRGEEAGSPERRRD